MAPEAFQDWFGYINSSKDVPNFLFGENWNSEYGLVEEKEENLSLDIPENQTENFVCADWNSPPPSVVQLQHLEKWGSDSSLEPHIDNTSTINSEDLAISSRAKRRRSKGKKKMEGIENQRMTHIAVERNRRKQINEYLSVLRSLMPHSYVQRGDQASIVGGAINYVKELEQQLQFLSGQNDMKQINEAGSSSSSPFDEFFTFPQYSTSLIQCENSIAAEHHSAIGDIEVTMVESHAKLKIRWNRQPKQLLKLVSGLQNLRLSVLHLSVTTVGQIALYSLSVMVEEDCKLTSVDEIATALNQLLATIQAETDLI